MIGIVVVSHSAKLADGVVELARNMGGPEVQIQAAGGLDLPDQPLGTDPILILAAIEKVYSDEGVLVLMDLGSALLSSEMALEMLPDEKRLHVILCEAPVVEGAIAAAVQARIGSSLQQVAAEARCALVSKAEHLNTAVQGLETIQTGLSTFSENEKLEIKLQVRNALGLHARPAARFVKTAGSFPQAEIQVKNLSTGRGPVSAKSINAMTTLGVLHGQEILVSAAGAEAQAALQAIQTLADDNFGDIDGAETSPVQPVFSSPLVDNADGTGVWRGAPASGGIAIGKAFVLQAVLPEIPEHRIEDPVLEWETFKKSLEKTRVQIRADLAQAARKTSTKTAEIFEAHLLFLEDEALLEPAREIVFNQKLNAAAAWQQSVKSMVVQYRATADVYIQARAQDVQDVGQLVLANFLQIEASAPHLARPCILVATDLTPAETARLNTELVLGICTAAGGPLSHSAILARSMGIPAVTGLGSRLLELEQDTPLVMDGESGQVWVNPSQEMLEEYSRQMEAARQVKARALAESRQPACTLDGRVLEIAANIGSAKDAALAVQSGAEGVGLFRTEFLFLERQSAPSEEEQYQAYRSAVEALAGRPMIIRTLDAGGDKYLPYLHQDVEANPFLGWRAIRLCLSNPSLFKTQLRAIARTAAEFPVKLMFPMVAALAEWRAARQLWLEACAEVGQSKLKVETGIMVEIPSAAVMANQFAREVDFFSIGTNDLTQYTLAAERGNAHVANLSDPFFPAVLNLIHQVVEAAHANGKWVGVCGEMAGDPLAIPMLVGLGVDELSMSGTRIPQAKQVVRSLDYQKLSQQVLPLLTEESPEAVREKLKRF